MTRQQAISYRLSGALAALTIATGIAPMVWTAVDPYRVDNGKHMSAGAILMEGVIGTVMILYGVWMMFRAPSTEDRP